MKENEKKPNYNEGRLIGFEGSCWLTKDKPSDYYSEGYKQALADVKAEIEKRIGEIKRDPKKYLDATASIWSLQNIKCFIEDRACEV